MNKIEWIKVCDSTKKYGTMSQANDVYKCALEMISDFNKEHFLVLGLNTKHKIIYIEVVSIGTLDSSLIHPREVFRKAIINNCHSIIVAHNHPSGDPDPSNEDRKVTKTLRQAGEILAIKVLDHVILGCKIYYSFNEHGDIE